MPAVGSERVLDSAECWKLLHGHPHKVGRIAHVDEGLPVILPVNYRVDGTSIVYRTRPGAKLAVASRGGLCAFEVDDVDVAWRAGWSVLLQGRTEHVTDRHEIARLEKLGLRPWAPGVRDQWVRLRPIRVNGRRLS